MKKSCYKQKLLWSSYDFNNPVGQQGYQTILASPLKLQDSHTAAKEAIGEATEGTIVGWDDNKHALKIDYVSLAKGWTLSAPLSRF